MRRWRRGGNSEPLPVYSRRSCGGLHGQVCSPCSAEVAEGLLIYHLIWFEYIFLWEKKDKRSAITSLVWYLVSLGHKIAGRRVRWTVSSNSQDLSVKQLNECTYVTIMSCLFETTGPESWKCDILAIRRKTDAKTRRYNPEDNHARTACLIGLKKRWEFTERKRNFISRKCVTAQTWFE